MRALPILCLLAGCTLVFGPRRHDAPDGGPRPDGGGTCLDSSHGDPHRCGPDCNTDCTRTLPNADSATIYCESGNCKADGCLPGYGNCTGNPYAGCPTSITSAQTCGACNTSCSGSMPYCSADGAFFSCSATNTPGCFVNADCPAVDCAACHLTCSAAGKCCVAALDGYCNSNSDCCPGTVCHDSRGSGKYCDSPQPGDPCSMDGECAPLKGVCQNNACCLPLGSACYQSGCCSGLACEPPKIGSSDEICCVPLRTACSQASDCCILYTGGAAACQGNKCCIPSGQMGCNSNLDCCAGSPGCVGGMCK
jgi:hypothetical protein